MPELPEVETVRRLLKPTIVGQTFTGLVSLSPRQLDPGAPVMAKALKGRTIKDVQRRGKFLILPLDDGSHLVCHLRMEGKLFHLAKDDPWSDPHDRVIFTLASGDKLIFNDTRRFGRLWYYAPEAELACLSNLGPEATDLKPDYVYKKLRAERRPIKEVLLDQSVFAGIGNIYADEICFACHLNPFLPAKDIADLEQASADIARESARILELAIQSKGSTVRTYQAANHVKGSFQDLLKVYGRAGKPCTVCHTPICKRELKGRGTSFCPRCQGVPAILGITGGIAAGKTTVCKILEARGFYYISTDEEAKRLYEDPKVIKILSKIDPACFGKKGVDKDYLRRRLSEDKPFRRRWLTALYSALKEKVIHMINSQPDKPFAIEAPLLFQAKMDTLCTRIIQVVTPDPLARLIERGSKNPQAQMKLASTNDWERYTPQCDAIIATDGPRELLKSKVDDCLKILGI